MIRFTKEYHIDSRFRGDFEGAFAATGAFGSMFVRHGCESYALFKDKLQRDRYIVTHTWPDYEAFTRAQEGAAQESYNFQQQSRGWVVSVVSLDDTEAGSVLDDPEDHYEVLSST